MAGRNIYIHNGIHALAICLNEIFVVKNIFYPLNMTRDKGANCYSDMQ